MVDINLSSFTKVTEAREPFIASEYNPTEVAELFSDYDNVRSFYLAVPKILKNWRGVKDGSINREEMIKSVNGIVLVRSDVTNTSITLKRMSVVAARNLVTRYASWAPFEGFVNPLAEAHGLRMNRSRAEDMCYFSCVRGIEFMVHVNLSAVLTICKLRDMYASELRIDSTNDYVSIANQKIIHQGELVAIGSVIEAYKLGDDYMEVITRVVPGTTKTGGGNSRMANANKFAAMLKALQGSPKLSNLSDVIDLTSPLVVDKPIGEEKTIGVTISTEELVDNLIKEKEWAGDVVDLDILKTAVEKMSEDNGSTIDVHKRMSAKMAIKVKKILSSKDMMNYGTTGYFVTTDEQVSYTPVDKVYHRHDELVAAVEGLSAGNNGGKFMIMEEYFDGIRKTARKGKLDWAGILSLLTSGRFNTIMASATSLMELKGNGFAEKK
jgi:hypothetical protein